MHEAAALGHYDIVQCLLKNGANPKAYNELNQTPRDMAVLADQEQIIRLLDSGTGS
jgi:ankyrin repeat protein